MLINDKDELFFKDNDVNFFATVVLPKFIYCPSSSFHNWLSELWFSLFLFLSIGNSQSHLPQFDGFSKAFAMAICHHLQYCHHFCLVSFPCWSIIQVLIIALVRIENPVTNKVQVCLLRNLLVITIMSTSY